MSVLVPGCRSQLYPPSPRSRWAQSPTGKACPRPEGPPSTPHTPGTRKTYLKEPGGHRSQGWEGPVLLSVLVLQREHTACSTSASPSTQAHLKCVSYPLRFFQMVARVGIFTGNPLRSGVLCQGGVLPHKCCPGQWELSSPVWGS